jgi:hypothetical protein
MVVSKKGEKFVFESLEPVQDKSTYVSLKIKTKGKRGPGVKFS